MLFILQLLLFFLGAFGQDWSAKYTQTQICALKGSTVFMHSDYKYPSHLQEVKTFWTINLAKHVEPTDLTKDPEYSGRTEYFRGGKQLLSLRLTNVMERDERMYCLRITTNIERERYSFYPGVTLNVTGLRVESPERVSEGDTTRLTCTTTCPLTDGPTYIWYKNGRRVDRNEEDTNVLPLQPTRIEDTGIYSCAVRGYEHLPSPAVALSVRYPPKNVSVSISPSGEIVEGSSVTLTCSGDANPPVDEYSWFKQKDFLGKGKDYTISNISSEDGGEYKCKTSNAEGHWYSAGITLNVVAVPSVVPYVAVAAVLCGLAALLTVLIWCRRQKKRRDEHDYQNVDPNAQNDTYAALQPTARFSDQVYHTLTKADPDAQDDTYAALQPTARSSDDVYHTLATSSPDDPYTALDPQSRSPEYDTLAVRSTH
ncbi:hypothetical protein AOLI_G00234400 [Acnodon oligacanthus]